MGHLSVCECYINLITALQTLLQTRHFKDAASKFMITEGLRRSFATPNPFVLTDKICLNQSSIRNLMLMLWIASIEKWSKKGGRKRRLREKHFGAC